MLLSYEKVKHIVEVDENILAVFTIKSAYVEKTVTSNIISIGIV